MAGKLLIGCHILSHHKNNMPFECKKYHSKCNARCCGCFPMAITLWQKNQHNIQKEVIGTQKCYANDSEGNRHTCVLPSTKDMLCPFLKKDFTCAIYEQRPAICRKFGDETHWALCCPMQHKDGKIREDYDKVARQAVIGATMSMLDETSI